MRRGSKAATMAASTSSLAHVAADDDVSYSV
jgi:hypothetical protein